MKRLALVVLALALVACGSPTPITNLPLAWRGVAKSPRATTAVDEAFAAVPLALSDVKDLREDKKAVGLWEEQNHVVATSDDVARFCTERLRAMLSETGAKLEDGATTRLAPELLEHRVVEGGMFNATTRLRVTVTRDGVATFTKVYEGKSKRWGRTHNPENYNEALSNALAEATRKLVQDAAFAEALSGKSTEPRPAAPDPSSETSL